eukprot:14850787-Alexandrium_andersonii.AAC.1
MKLGFARFQEQAEPHTANHPQFTVDGAPQQLPSSVLIACIGRVSACAFAGKVTCSCKVVSFGTADD